jgi:hypothetical protein
MSLNDYQERPSLEAGVYEMTLLEVTTKEQPKFGKPNEMETRVVFKFEEPISGVWAWLYTSQARGPKSKLLPVLEALNQGRMLDEATLNNGQRCWDYIQSRIGQIYLVKLERKPESQYSKVTAVLPLPKPKQPQQVGTASSTGVAMDNMELIR